MTEVWKFPVHLVWLNNVLSFIVSALRIYNAQCVKRLFFHILKWHEIERGRVDGISIKFLKTVAY